MRKSLEDKRKMSIFAASKRGIRRKDDNLYGLQRSFRAPVLRAITLRVVALFCYLVSRGTVAWLWQHRDDEQFDLAAWFPSLKYRAGHVWPAFIFSDTWAA